MIKWIMLTVFSKRHLFDDFDHPTSMFLTFPSFLTIVIKYYYSLR